MKHRPRPRAGGTRKGAMTAAGAMAAIVAWCGSAEASNGARPRTPPIFQQAECLSVVDRTVDPNFVVEFSIPIEDATLTEDELADSRRFQFFALCSDTQSQIETLPNWITTEDAQRSFDAGLIEAMPETADVVETNADWSGCVLPINAGDARIPITCEATEGGAVWDTTGVPAGNYVVRGYNFEPSLNLWRARQGVVQVTDGEVRPVVSLMSPPVRDNTAYETAGPLIEGCMAGPQGTTVSLSWARLVDLGEDDPSDWTVFAELDASEGEFSVLFEPPAAAVNQAIVFRGEAAAPSGDRWLGYSTGSVIVFPGDGEADGPEPPPGLDHCGFYPPPDPPQDDPTTGGSTGGDDGGSSSGSEPTTGDTEADTDEGSDTANADPTSDDGCGCQVPRQGVGHRWLWLLVLAVPALARRRLSPAV